MDDLTPARALGRAIDSERVASGIRRRDLADALTVDEKTIGRYIRGETGLTVAQLRTIAQEIGVTPQYLLDRADTITGRPSRHPPTPQQTAGDASTQVAGDASGAVIISAGDGDRDINVNMG